MSAEPNLSAIIAAAVQEERERIAEFVERFGARLEAGPALREFGHPINRKRYDDDFARPFALLTAGMAGSIRTGCAEAEIDWPELEDTSHG